MTGTIIRFKEGPKPMIVGCILGAVFGCFIGLTTSAGMKVTGNI